MSTCDGPIVNHTCSVWQLIWFYSLCGLQTELVRCSHSFDPYRSSVGQQRKNVHPVSCWAWSDDILSAISVGKMACHLVGIVVCKLAIWLSSRGMATPHWWKIYFDHVVSRPWNGAKNSSTTSILAVVFYRSCLACFIQVPHRHQLEYYVRSGYRRNWLRTEADWTLWFQHPCTIVNK